MLAAAVKPHAGYTDSGPRTSSREMNDTGSWATERSGALPRFRTTGEQLSEGASVREDLAPGIRGVLTKKGARARTTKRHELVSVTSEEHYWNQGIADHKGQTAPPVAASSSFMQSPSSLATPVVLNAPVDFHGQGDITAAVRSRPLVTAGLSRHQIEAKNEFDRRFAEGFQLTAESIFTGET
ncbi:rhoptry kinase family ROP19B [Toxoplasma gondii GAB2-2007-GAL-DOM2]|nr:rhoptry kinase family ROP19B [Toxoplasma gondii GAB2-2007-GAL-DOM2]